MTGVILLAFLSQAQVCEATVFAYPGDHLAGGVAPYLGRRVRHTDNGIAHRRLPLGSRVTVCLPRTGRCIRSRVIDRGPFGLKGRTWRNGAALYRRKRRAGKPIPRGIWRGCADLTPRVQKAIGHSGKEPVILLPSM